MDGNFLSAALFYPVYVLKAAIYNMFTAQRGLDEYYTFFWYNSISRKRYVKRHFYNLSLSFPLLLNFSKLIKFFCVIIFFVRIHVNARPLETKREVIILEYINAVAKEVFRTGWADVNWEDPNLHSPNLYNLATNGIVLNNSYVQPLCSP